MTCDLDEVPFESVEEAWFWAMGALRARRDGESGSGGGRQRRPCDPDDVLLCVEKLYRAERIDLSHARVLRHWGEFGGRPPLDAAPAHYRLWKEAMSSLDQTLRLKGIVSRKKGLDGAAAAG